MTYNKKIRILQSTDVQDEIGNTDCVWTEIFHGWASVNNTGGRKYYDAAQTNSQNDVIFTIRYCRSASSVKCKCCDSDPDYRIAYNGRMYAVKHVDDFMESHRELVFRTEEVRI
ncbi:MAG: phage head closure protein [Oscillospiraceae bacterium]|nr:phage head closure protein [Oscillospiraceae bacterium]